MPNPKVSETPKRSSTLNTEGLAPQLIPNGKDAAQEERIEPAPFLALFRFADRWDLLVMALGIVGSVANGVMMPVFSIVFGKLLNSFGQNQNDPSMLADAVNSTVIKFLYIGVAAFVAANLQMACWTFAAVRQMNRIRQRYLGAVLRQDIGYFDTRTTSGRLLQGLNEDCITLQKGIGDKLGITVFNLSTAVAGITIAFTRGWDMAFVVLAVTPILIVTGFLVSKFIRSFTAVANRAYAESNTVAQQALSNIRTVYSFNGEEKTAEAYAVTLQLPLKVGIRQGILQGLTLGTAQCVGFCSYALALWYGSTRVADGDYTGGQVINVLMAAIMGGYSLGQAAPNLEHFQTAKVAGGRIFELMSRQPDIDPDAEGETLQEVQGNVAFEDVEFAYPSRPDVTIFSHFDLEVPAGHTVALVGESGSGKSTVIGLIERFYDPREGQVLLDGVDIRRLQLHFLRAQLGLVSQEPTLFATTIATNISFGKPGASMEEIIQASKSANAHSFITGLPKGYDTHVGELGTQMSGGQKQRIAIARAILKDPKVLLLDEATSALDAQSESVVQDALDRLMVNRTTVVVAHRLSTVIDADCIAVVKKGHIVEQGTHAELMTANREYATLVALQQAEGGMQGPAEEEQSGSEQGGQQGVAVQQGGTEPAAQPAARPSTGEDKGPSAGGDNTQMAPRAAGGDKVEKVAQVVVSVKGGLSQALSSKALVPFPQRAVSGWRQFYSMRHRTLPADGGNKGAAPDAAKQEPEEKVKPVPFKRLAALNLPELPAALGGLIGAGALGAMMPTFAIAFSSLINVLYSPDIEDLKSGARKWCLVFVGIGCGALCFGMLQSYSFNFMGQKLAHRVRIMMMRALLRQEVAFYDQERNSSGALTSRLSADALAVKGQFGDTMGLLTQSLVTLVGGVAIGFIHSWKMSLVVMGALPLIAAAGATQTKLLIKASTKEEEMYAQANQTATEAISAIRTVAAFGMEQEVSSLYGQKLERPTRQARDRSIGTGLAYGFSQFTIFGVYCLSFWFAGILVKNGDNTFDQVLKVFFGLFMAAMGAARSQLYYPDVALGKAATKRVFAVIDRKPAIDAGSPEGEKPLRCSGAVELKEVTFAYPSRPEVVIFRRFSLNIPAGHTVALVGESGSGKSTVIGLIERFYDPREGQVLLDGVDIRLLNLHWLRERIALVSQEPVLFGESIIENIRYGKPDASLEEVMVVARAANVHSFIEELPNGYDTVVGEQGSQLSGGQKQRVALARALIKDPWVLLLDEATSALDAESEHAVQEALNNIMAGRTTLVVAHRLSTVKDADSIAVVHHGRIVEQGSHDELMAKPHGTYARLVHNQFARGRTTIRAARTRLERHAAEATASK